MLTWFTKGRDLVVRVLSSSMRAIGLRRRDRFTFCRKKAEEHARAEDDYLRHAELCNRFRETEGRRPDETAAQFGARMDIASGSEAINRAHADYHRALNRAYRRAALIPWLPVPVEPTAGKCPVPGCDEEIYSEECERESDPEEAEWRAALEARARRRRYVRLRYAASDRLVLLQPIEGGRVVSQPYRGEPFDPTLYRLDPGGWNHDHCCVCGATVLPGDEWWTSLPPDDVGLCLACHARLFGPEPVGRRLPVEPDPHRPGP
jgi:hypothetical protein